MNLGKSFKKGVDEAEDLAEMVTKHPIQKTLTTIRRAIPSPGEIFTSIEQSLHGLRKGRLRLLPNPLPHPSKDEGESLAIPSYRQLDSYSCGAVAGWMIVKALHPTASFKDFYLRCSPTPKNGVGNGKLVKVLRESGVGISTRKNGVKFADIKKAITDGFPILAIVDRPLTSYAHWVVIYGYSSPKKTRQKLVYLAGNNFLGIHTSEIAGPNPIPYSEFSYLAEEFPAYVCWGK